MPQQQKPESFADLTFPVAGVNVVTEFGEPPPATTPLGVNVRAFETLTNRGRGGSRSGLVRFIDQALPLV